MNYDRLNMKELSDKLIDATKQYFVENFPDKFEVTGALSIILSAHISSVVSCLRIMADIIPKEHGDMKIKVHNFTEELIQFVSEHNSIKSTNRFLHIEH